MAFFENTRKPTGFGGRLMVTMMNIGHRALADWGLRFLPLAENADVLDCGCGGGANLRLMLKKCPTGKVCGIDYSPVSVEKSRKLNQAAIDAGRCEVLQASVQALPFDDAQFDVATAFETVYFWGDLPACFREVGRVLKPGGTFFLCNESDGDHPQDEKWTEKIPGMTIYKDTQLKTMLEQVGFRQVETHKNGKGWLCVTARK